jgi:conjugal transfer ATP-binding protein TraC
MNVLTLKYKSQNISDFINLETFTSDSHLIIAKAEGDKMMAGRVYEMSPLSGGGSEFSDVIQNIAKTSPDDTVIQVSLLCHPDHNAASTFMKNKTGGGELVQELVARKAKLLTDALEYGWQPDVPPINVRKVIISTSTPIGNTSDKTLADITAQENGFLNNLKSCGFYDATPRSAAEVVSIYRHYFNIFKPRETVELDDGMELKYQISGSDETIDFRDKSVGQFNSDTFVACVTPKAYPRYSFHGLMNLVSGAPFNLGPAKEGGGQRVLTPFILTTTIRIANQRKEWGRIDDAIRSREVSQNFIIKLGNEDPAEKHKDLQLLKKQCAVEGNKFVSVSTTMFLFARTREQALNAASNFKGTLDKLDFDGRTVFDNAIVRFAQILPLNYSPKIAEKLKGDTMMAASAAGSLLPVFGDNLGNVNTSKPDTGCPYITRRATVHYWDPFISDTHFSGLLAAEPGAGKSFALQDFIVSQLAMGRYVYLLDNGRSAKKFCIAAGGEYNEFGGSDKFTPSLNPFSGLTYDEFNDQKEGITALLMLMAFEGEEPDKGAKIAMSEAVNAAYNKKQGDADIPEVIESLRTIVDSNKDADKPDIVARAAVDLVPRLNAFINNPNRGKYFEGKGTINPKNQFCVFEIGSLGDDLHLKKCVLFFVLNTLINRTKGITGKKLIIADEAHDLIEDPTAGPALEGIYLKGRKDGISIWIVVQSLLKLNETPAGSTILNQSAWRLVLQQPPEEIDKALDQKLISTFIDDPYFKRLIRSTKSQKGVYSEIMIIGRNSYEVVRLYVDKWTATLFSSEGEARDLVFKWIEGGMNPIEAVNKLLNDTSIERAKWISTFIEQLASGYKLSGDEILSEIGNQLKIGRIVK